MLQREERIFINTNVLLTFFLTEGSIPNLLHTVQVPVIPNGECQEWFKESGHSKVIKPEFICAGYKNGKKDSCEVHINFLRNKTD